MSGNGSKSRADVWYRNQQSMIVGRKGSAGEVTITEDCFWPLDVTYFVDFDRGCHDLRYLYHLLCWLDLPRLTKGVKPGLNREEAYAQQAPVPPLAEQQRIAATLDQTFKYIDVAAANVQKNLLNVRELFERILAAEFFSSNQTWMRMPLDDVCKFVRGPFGGALKKEVFKEHGYAVYEQQHAIHGDFSAFRYFIDGAKFADMCRFQISPGDLIMSCSGTMGKVAIVPPGAPKGVINQALLLLRVGAKSSPHFIQWWMKTRQFRDAIIERSGGAAMQNLASVATLKEIMIEIPPSHIQKSVIERVEFVHQQYKAFEAMCERRIDALTELKQSLLARAFSGELTASDTLAA